MFSGGIEKERGMKWVNSDSIKIIKNEMPLNLPYFIPLSRIPVTNFSKNSSRILLILSVQC